KSRILVARVDRRSPPREIPNVDGDGPLFGDGEILFRARERDYGYAYRVREDGTRLQKANDQPVIETGSVSPDGRWLLVYARPNGEAAGGTLAVPVGGGPPVQIYGRNSRMKWSADRRFVFLSVSPERAYVLPLRPGNTL